MTELRARQAARGGQTDGVSAPARYAPPELEHRAVRVGAGLLERPERGLLHVTGPDAAAWLQGLVSNDVRLLQQVGDRLQACQLDARGHMVADLTLVRLEEGILVEMDASLLAPLTALWDDLLVMEDAALRDVSEEWKCFSVQGPRAREAAADIRFDGMFTVIADHTGSGGLDFYVPADRAVLFWERLADKAQPVGTEVAEVLRVEAGIPRHLVDTDSSVIPVEAGLEATHISYTKGCYLGQEIIARLQSRGHTNRALAGLLLEQMVEPGSLLTLRDEPNRPVGRITSVVHSIALGRPIALGYVRHEHRANGTSLIVPKGDRRVSAEVCGLPFPGAL